MTHALYMLDEKATGAHSQYEIRITFPR